MTDREISSMYRWSKNKSEQIQILADLNCTEPLEIIKILVRNEEKLPAKEMKKLYKRLDELDTQIAEREKEYRKILQAINGE